MIPGSTDQKLLNCGSLIEQVYPDRHERNQDSRESRLKSQVSASFRTQALGLNDDDNIYDRPQERSSQFHEPCHR